MDRALRPELRPPDRLSEHVHVAGSGEFFWPRDEAVEAARWLASMNVAIIGGEVYRRFPGFWATYLGEWETAPAWLPSEPWRTFVERGLAQVMREVAAAGSSDLFFFAQSARGGYAAVTGLESTPPGPEV